MSYDEKINLICSQEDSGDDNADGNEDSSLLNSLDDLKERFENEYTCIEADSNIKIQYTAKKGDKYDLLMVMKNTNDNLIKFINKSDDDCTLFTNNRDNIWSPSTLNDSSFTLYFPKHAIRLSAFAFRTPKDEQLAKYMPGTFCLFGFNDEVDRWDVLQFTKVQTLKIDSRYDLDIVNGTQKNFYRAFSFLTYSEHFALSFFKLYGDLITQDDEIDMSVIKKGPRVFYNNMPVIEGNANKSGIFDSALKIFGPKLENFVVALYEKGEKNDRVADLWEVEFTSHFKSRLLVNTKYNRPNTVSFFFPNHVIYLEGYKIIAHESPNVSNWCVCLNTDTNSPGIVVHERKNAELIDRKRYIYEIDDIEKNQRFCRIIRFVGFDKQFSFRGIEFIGKAIPAGHKKIDLSSLYTCPYPSIVEKTLVNNTSQPKSESQQQTTKNKEQPKTRNDTSENRSRNEEQKPKPRPVRRPSPPSSSSSSESDDDDDYYDRPRRQPQRPPSKVSNQPQRPPSKVSNQPQRPPSNQSKNAKPEPPKEPTKFYCKYCGRCDSSISMLTGSSCSRSPNGKHIPFEGDTKGPFYCMYCGKRDSSISMLTGSSCSRSPNGKHIPFESSGQPEFYCKYCGRRDSSISMLTGSSCSKSPNKKHIPYSGGPRKRYYCRYCGRSDSSISMLTGSSCQKSPNGKHIPYSGDERKRYYCKYCGKSDSSISMLTGSSCQKSPNGKHIPYSGGDKRRYYCKYCGRSDSSISMLTGSSCQKSPNGKHIPKK